jgi:glycerol dehydrogenase-like iron-containing ADH family enzyme
MGELFPVTYGSGLARQLGATIPAALVITQPEPWALVEPQFGAAPVSVTMIPGLERDELERLVSELPPASSVVGIGGGTAMDAAKWIHWRRGIPLFQVPTLPSVNACFTHMTAVREAGGVHYYGDAIPEMVFVDFDLMRAAPPFMIRSGIGDVIGCHTGPWDWQYAVSRGHPPLWDAWLAGESARIIGLLNELAPGIKNGSDIGLRGLMELHRLTAKYCDDYQHGRFVEGSEHFFAYCLEHVTGRSFLHGEIVSLGACLMSTLQGNRPELVRDVLVRGGVRFRPQEIGVSWDEVDTTLRALKGFVTQQGLWYSVANDLEIGPAQLELAREAVAGGGTKGP